MSGSLSHRHFVRALDTLETEVPSPPDPCSSYPLSPVSISSLAGVSGKVWTGGDGRDGIPGRAQLSTRSCSPGLPTGTFGAIAGTVQDSRLIARDFHPQPEMCSVLACIPEEQLLSRADDGGNSLGSFLPPGTRRGHCVCPGQPGVSSQQLPWAGWFLSQPLPFPKPPPAAAAPLGEAREPGRKGSCPGLGWDVFLPATVPGIHRALGLEQNASAGTAAWAMAAPAGKPRGIWNCRMPRQHLGHGPGPDPGPDPRCAAWAPRAASSLGCPNPYTAQWDRREPELPSLPGPVASAGAT